MGIFRREAASSEPVPAASACSDRRQMLFDRVVDYINSQGWNFGIDDELIRLNMGLKCKLGSCRLVVVVTETEIQSLGFSPIKATPDTIASTVEFITRSNYRLKIGKWEIDYNDGEVRFQACLPCAEGVPSMRDIERVVDLPMLMLQRYGDGLAKNIMGFGDPAQDIADIEK